MFSYHKFTIFWHLKNIQVKIFKWCHFISLYKPIIWLLPLRYWNRLPYLETVIKWLVTRLNMIRAKFLISIRKISQSYLHSIVWNESSPMYKVYPTWLKTLLNEISFVLFVSAKRQISSFRIVCGCCDHYYNGCLYRVITPTISTVIFIQHTSRKHVCTFSSILNSFF